MTWGGVSGVLKWATMFWVNLKVFPSLVVYNGILENYRIQVNPKKGKIVCCVAAVLNHHSILAIVFDVNCPHLYSNVECGHEKQGGHLVQTLSRGRLFSRLVIVQDTDTTQGWKVHGDIAGAPRRPRTPPILSKTRPRPPLMTKSPGLPYPSNSLLQVQDLHVAPKPYVQSQLRPLLSFHSSGNSGIRPSSHSC